MIYILYNPYSRNGQGQLGITKLNTMVEGEKEFVDITAINIKEFYDKLDNKDEIIISGGDGTINRFANEIYDIKRDIKLSYYPSGTGNDFSRDVLDSKESKIFQINKYIERLPLATVKGREYRFLNNIGFGLDGYCCERGDELKKKSKKKVNYSLIALKGIFFAYKNTNATVYVDGQKYEFTDVLMAPTMKGRYYGGGIKITPNQDREVKDAKVSVAIVHNLKKYRIPVVFPKIYAGKHTKYTDVVTMLTGSEIKVVFDREASVQIDGETISGVKEYTVTVKK